MKVLLSRASTHLALRYVLAYTLFIVLSVLALLILMRLRVNLIQFGVYFDFWHRAIYALQMWGLYLLFIPYIAAVVWLEAYMNEAARKNMIWRRAFRVIIIEAILGSVTLLLSLSMMIF